MMDFELRIGKIQPTKTATHPRLEIDFEPDLQNTPFGGQAKVLEGHADVEISSGSHTGLTLPRMHIETSCLADTPQIQNLELLTGILDLDHYGLGKIEEMRDKFRRDLEITFHLSLLVQSRNDDSPTRYVGTGSAEIPARDWEAVLDGLGYHDHRVVELSIPDAQIVDVLENAHGQLERAQEHHDAHRYDDSVAAVRKAILKLDHIEQDTDAMEVLAGEKQERVLDAIDEFRSSLMALKAATDLGSHPEEQITDMEEPPTRRDSELAIDVAKAYVRYVSRVIEESEEEFS